MTIDRANDAVRSAIAGGESQPFRKGVITAITAGSPIIYTVHGQPMTATRSGLAVGDRVVYYTGLDPFILGKFAGT